MNTKISILDLLIVMTVVAVGVVMNSQPRHEQLFGVEFRDNATVMYGEPCRFLAYWEESDRTDFHLPLLIFDVVAWGLLVGFCLTIKNAVSILVRFFAPPDLS